MTSPPPKKAKSSPIGTVIRIVVSVGLLILLFYQVGPGHIFNAIRHANPWWVLIIFGLMFLEHMHATYKWLILLKHKESHVRFWPLVRIRYLSAFIGTFGLGAVTIELVRMYGLARYISNLAMSFTSILMDRMLGLTGLCLMILFGVIMESRDTIPGIEFWAGAAIVMIAFAWIAIMSPKFRKLTDGILAKCQSIVAKTHNKNGSQSESQEADEPEDDQHQNFILRITAKILFMVRDKQNKVYMSLDTYRGRPGLLAWGMVQSLIFNVLRIMVVVSAGIAVGIDIPVGAYFVVAPVALFVALIPISMSGWGAREGVFAALLPLFGADKDMAIAMSLLVGIIHVISTTPGAVMLLIGTGTAIPDNPNNISTPEKQV